MISLLVADSQFVVRMGMKELSKSSEHFSVRGEAANGDEVMAALGSGQFDMVMLDPMMRDSGRDSEIGGIGLIRRIRTRYTNIPILVFTAQNEPLLAKRVLGAGASGFIGKECEPDVLIKAIRKVADGERYVDPCVVEEIMFERPSHRESSLHEHLSERELQIMKLLAHGKSVGQIGDALFISARTVSTHKGRLMLKMRFKSNAELVLYASQCGLLDTPDGRSI
jgi:DNA-binding NarL/FixJ family response regulator